MQMKYLLQQNACVVPEDFKQHKYPLLLTWFNFNPSMDK